MSHAVMIIDDSPLERYMTETIVKRSLSAVKIISFPSASAAIEHLRALPAIEGSFPSVIFLDIYMPVMNGFDFLDEYAAFPENVRERCKIVMFSSTENDEDHARMRKYKDIYKFLSKPLSDTVIEEVSYLWRS